MLTFERKLNNIRNILFIFQIISVIGGNAIACQIVLYNLNETSVYNSDDMKIDVSMGCVKIIFLNWFVNSVLVKYTQTQMSIMASLQINCHYYFHSLSWIIFKLHSERSLTRPQLQPKQLNKTWSTHTQMLHA